MILTMLIFAVIMMASALVAEIAQEYDRTIILRDLYEMITLDDGTNWILVGDHWVQANLTGHADWCVCKILE